MADAPPFPLTSPFRLLPGDRQIVQAGCSDIALTILQGLMRTRSHITGTGRWANLEQLLWESEPPSTGPFHSVLNRCAENMRPRKMKERAVAILDLHEDYDSAVLTNLSRIQPI